MQEEKRLLKLKDKYVKLGEDILLHCKDVKHIRGSNYCICGSAIICNPKGNLLDDNFAYMISSKEAMILPPTITEVDEGVFSDTLALFIENF